MTFRSMSSLTPSAFVPTRFAVAPEVMSNPQPVAKAAVPAAFSPIIFPATTLPLVPL
jgi:hypothetical protein